MGNSALLVDPLDTQAIAAAIQSLASNGELRQQLTAKGFENVKKFTWQETCRSHPPHPRNLYPENSTLIQFTVHC
ncbi:MAG: hypothetical protein M5U34_40025 [Chloroflexi bacterium]|nr:hypothetical protein [Chloroflexota bacterium]